jgi:hypothetical protein
LDPLRRVQYSGTFALIDSISATHCVFFFFFCLDRWTPKLFPLSSIQASMSQWSLWK